MITSLLRRVPVKDNKYMQEEKSHMENKAGVMSKPQVFNNFWDCGKQMSLNECMSQDGEKSQLRIYTI